MPNNNPWAYRRKLLVVKSKKSGRISLVSQLKPNPQSERSLSNPRNKNSFVNRVPPRAPRKRAA